MDVDIYGLASAIAARLEKVPFAVAPDGAPRLSRPVE